MDNGKIVYLLDVLIKHKDELTRQTVINAAGENGIFSFKKNVQLL